MPAEEATEEVLDGEEYPDGEEEPEPEDALCAELTMEELKAAFRIFDDIGEGFISVGRFKQILKEIDEDFTDEELDEIIAEIDIDKSSSIDFNEFVKLMTF
eukprot:TRINITY_DN8804_c0_g1_i4.p1 TRINITY_DN8804_c0_g1~~TRINITY_DN8804_c0_g1_i4.p1  ORF type:complete len:101 (-),score=42.15 TRINITY_DN8804_c0_g1_i4:55-357(-)